MNAALDVHYREGGAVVACVQFDRWEDAEPAAVRTTAVGVAAPYVPGRFYERELPCLLQALAREPGRFDAIVVDGYAYLKAPRGMGLGAHLADALPYRAAVVGVAKAPSRLAARFVPVLRGRSRRPLFVSAVGAAPEAAGEWIARMHGEFRIPTLLRLADRLGRGA